LICWKNRPKLLKPILLGFSDYADSAMAENSRNSWSERESSRAIIHFKSQNFGIGSERPARVRRWCIGGLGGGEFITGRLGFTEVSSVAYLDADKEGFPSK